MAQHITVVDHNPAWAAQYAAEAEKLRAVLGENCTAIHHIGSTAVPGLMAKPILDIMPVVRDLRAVDRAAEDFRQLGYEYLGEFGIPGRRYLRKGGDERTHQVHIFQADDTENIERHLAVRDYLRTHDASVRQYGALKARLAQAFPYDIEGYCDGKDALSVFLFSVCLQRTGSPGAASGRGPRSASSVFRTLCAASDWISTTRAPRASAMSRRSQAIAVWNEHPTTRNTSPGSSANTISYAFS